MLTFGTIYASASSLVTHYLIEGDIANHVNRASPNDKNVRYIALPKSRRKKPFDSLEIHASYDPLLWHAIEIHNYPSIEEFIQTSKLFK